MTGLTGLEPPLVERDEQIALVEALARRALARRGGVVVVTGEPGVGKTRLCTEAIERLDGDWFVSRLVCREGQSSAALLGKLCGAPTDNGFEAGRLIAARAEHAPQLIFLEDLHAADAALVDDLREVSTGIRNDRVLLLTTWGLGVRRVGSDHGRALMSLLGAADCTEIRLAPLSPAGTAALATAVGSDDETMFARTRGVPFLVEQLARAAADELPWTITEAVLARLAAMAPSAPDAARVLAVAGSPVPRAVLERLVADVDEALWDLATGGMIDDEEPHMSHELFADAVRMTMTPAERSAVHCRLADALEHERPPPAEQIAHHWSRGGDGPRAARWARTAATVLAAQKSLHAALDAWRLVLAAPSDDPLALADDLAQAGRCAALAGEVDLARGWLDRSSEAYAAAGRPDRADAIWLDVDVRYVPKPLCAHSASECRATGLLVDARQAGARGDFTAACRSAGDAIEVAKHRDELAVWADAAELLGAAGEPELASAALTECAHRARHVGDVLTTARALAGLSRLGWAVGDPAQAREANRAAFAAARAAPEAQTWRFLQVGLANALARQGELDDAEILARDLVAEGTPLIGTMAQFPLVLVELDRGPTDKTARRLTRLLDAVGDVDVPFLRVPVLSSRACWQLATGDPGAAVVTLATADDIAIGPFDDFRHDRLVLRARAAAALGDDDALVAADHSARALAGHPTSRIGAHAAADAVAGHLARRRDEPGAAAGRFEAAALAWGRAPRRVLAAEAWVDAAEAWRQAGDGEASRRAVERANHTIAALRLTPLGRRAAALAEQATARPRDHPQLRFLTCRELDVLELLAAGRTNREIGSALYLSEGTVRNYASSVFVKLGVTRRAEAAALAVRLGLTVGP